VLVGLPGAGKSTVAPILAERLGWRCVDMDAEIEREAGVSIAELFRSSGEPHFRAMEARLTVGLSSLTEIVLAPGAGWAAQPGLLEGLPPDTAVVWLRTEPAEALRRLSEGTADRPLLSGADPLAAISELARQRNEHYARADLIVDVDGRTSDHIVETITTWLERSTS
jgi:shikimate kinase